MKNPVIQLSVIFSFLIIFSSCKHDCPEPVDTTTTTYITTLNGAEFIDAMVTNFNPTINYGTRTTLDATAWTNGGTPFIERGFMKFDYSSIPAGAIIQKATLTLYADTTNTWVNGHSTMSGSNDWNLRKITSAWDVNAITWNTQPTNDIGSQLSLSASTSYKETYVIDLTNFVKDEFSSPSTAYGFMMQLVTESYYRTIMFASSDNADATRRPKLEIEYTK